MGTKVAIDIELYEFQIKTGSYESIENIILYFDEGLTAKEFLESLNKKLINKFLIMKIENISNNNISIYTVRTDKDGNIINFIEIGPNNTDNDMLIDAIVGCEPTLKFIHSCNDRIIEKCIQRLYEEGVGTSFTWTKDAKDRLKKMNSLRLKEIYKKLKS